jgi:hypothetical protein
MGVVMAVVTLMTGHLGSGRRSRGRGIGSQGEHRGGGQGSHGGCNDGDLGFHEIAPELIGPLRAAESITRREQRIRDMRLIMTAP